MKYNYLIYLSFPFLFSQAIDAEVQPLPSAAVSLESILKQDTSIDKADGSRSPEDYYQAIVKTLELEPSQQARYWAKQLSEYLNASDLVDPGGVQRYELTSAFLYNMPKPECWRDLSKELLKIDLGKGKADQKKGIQLLALAIGGEQKDFQNLLFEEESNTVEKQGLLAGLLGGGRNDYNYFDGIRSSYTNSYANVELTLKALDKELKASAKALKNKTNYSYVNISLPPLAAWLPEEDAKSYIEQVADLMVSEDPPVKGLNMYVRFPDDKQTVDWLLDALKSKKGYFIKYPESLISETRDRDLLDRVLKEKSKFSEEDQKLMHDHELDFAICDGDVERVKELLKGLDEKVKEVDSLDLDQMDTKTRKLILRYQMHKPKLYISPSNKKEKEVAYDTLVKLVHEPGSHIVWSKLIELGVKLGKVDHVLSLFSEAYPVGRIESLDNTGMMSSVASVYLSLDDLDSANQLRSKVISIYEKSFEEVLAKDGAEKVKALSGFPLGEMLSQYDKEADIAEALGELEKSREWHLKIIHIKDKISFEKLGGSKDLYDSVRHIIVNSAMALMDTKHVSLAHQTILDQLGLGEHFSKIDAENQRGYDAMGYYGDSSGNASELNENLVKLYRSTNQPEEIMWLLKNSPYWDKVDLYEFDDGEFLLDIVWALHQTGDKKTAYSLLSRKLLTGDLINDDAAYRELLVVNNPETEVLIDKLIESFPYQERPLIWKAQMALDKGDFAKAEKLARQGIAIDPSDGEQGKDDRMQVYAVLAEALAGLGETEDADFFKEVVKAIRMGEQADTLYYAGLTKRALDKYNESLTHFADAYCLQSRLAVYYADLGDMEKAEAHYQRAFELMPSSFGRIESHCFGCEGAFSNETAQTIASKVFTKAIAEKPDHPQNYYLMGYLEDSRDRPDKAVKFYQKATELDPEYVNAWKNLSGLDLKPTDENLALKKRAKINHMKLQPRGYLGVGSSRLTFDMAEVCKILEEVESSLPVFTERYPLVASAAKKSKKESLKKGTNNRRLELEDMANNMSKVRAAFLKDNLLNNLMRIVFKG